MMTIIINYYSIIIVLPVIDYNNILVERNSQTVLQSDNTGTVGAAFCHVNQKPTHTNCGITLSIITPEWPLCPRGWRPLYFQTILFLLTWCPWSGLYYRPISNIFIWVPQQYSVTNSSYEFLHCVIFTVLTLIFHGSVRVHSNIKK